MEASYQNQHTSSWGVLYMEAFKDEWVNPLFLGGLHIWVMYIVWHFKIIWRLPSLSELTPNISIVELTHIDLEASKLFL